MGWIFPVAGENEWSQGFWMPTTLTHRGRTHAATDIYAKEGTAIVSPVDGDVIAVGGNTAIGGNWVQFRGDDGIVYYFAHMFQPPSAKKGQRIQSGTYLGGVGRSGSAKRTSPHLHFSMKINGKAVNPTKWYKEGTKPDPRNYTFAYRDPRIAEGQDPFVNPESNAQPEDNQMRQNIMSMLDTMSNLVAGGQRQPSIMGAPVDDADALISDDDEEVLT